MRVSGVARKWHEGKYAAAPSVHTHWDVPCRRHLTSVLSLFCSSASCPTPRLLTGAANAKSSASSRLLLPHPLGPAGRKGRRLGPRAAIR